MVKGATQVVSFVSTKGGGGKSTAALLLAQVAAHRNKSVLVVDADTQGTLVDWFSQAFEAGRVPSNLEVQPATDQNHLRELYVEHHATTDLIVIDLPGAESPILSVASSFSDILIGPGRSNSVDIHGVLNAKGLVDRYAQESGYPAPPMFWLLTVFDHVEFGGTRAATPDGRRAVMEPYGIGTFDTFLSRRTPFHRIQSEGHTLWSLLGNTKESKRRDETIRKAIDQAEAYADEAFGILQEVTSNDE